MCELSRNIGEYVGCMILYNYLPTLSIDCIKTNRIIKVDEKDEHEEFKLKDIWFNNKGENEWENYRDFYVSLLNKYLPKKLECIVIKINEIVNIYSLKEGIIDYLWNCDICSYKLTHDDIDINFLEFKTIVILKLDV